MLRYSLLLIFLLPSLVIAELYRWTDENGQVHFSDRAQQSDSEQIELKAPPLIGQGDEVRQRNERWQRLKSAEQQKADEEAQKQKEKEAQQAPQRALCEKARKKLEILSGRVIYVDENGVGRDVSLEQVAADQKRIREWIAANCSD